MQSNFQIKSQRGLGSRGILRSEYKDIILERIISWLIASLWFPPAAKNSIYYADITQQQTAVMVQQMKLKYPHK